MVKITIEDSKGVNETVGNAVFAITTNAQDAGKARSIICAERGVDKRVVVMALADLASNAIDSLSNHRSERDF